MAAGIVVYVEWLSSYTKLVVFRLAFRIRKSVADGTTNPSNKAVSFNHSAILRFDSLYFYKQAV